MSTNRTAGGALKEATGSAAGDLRESSTKQKGTWQEATAQTRRTAGAHLRALSGERRDATGSSVHLRQRKNILKRMLIHVGAFNLSLIMRQSLGHGTPRGLSRAPSRVCSISCCPVPVSPCAR